MSARWGVLTAPLLLLSAFFVPCPNLTGLMVWLGTSLAHFSLCCPTPPSSPTLPSTPHPRPFSHLSSHSDSTVFAPIASFGVALAREHPPGFLELLFPCSFDIKIFLWGCFTWERCFHFFFLIRPFSPVVVTASLWSVSLFQRNLCVGLGMLGVGGVLGVGGFFGGGAGLVSPVAQRTHGARFVRSSPFFSPPSESGPLPVVCPTTFVIFFMCSPQT